MRANDPSAGSPSQGLSRRGLPQPKVFRMRANDPSAGSPSQGLSRRGLPHEGSEKAQNGHVVKGDCTWEIQFTKTWKREFPEGCAGLEKGT
jgi:hypothetical protein